MAKSLKELVEKINAGAIKNSSQYKPVKDGYSCEFLVDGKPITVVVDKELPFVKIFAKIELMLEKDYD